MADVKILSQFSVFLVNKPGVLAQVTGALAAEKINLVALTLVDSQEHGVLRLVPEDPAETLLFVESRLELSGAEVFDSSASAEEHGRGIGRVEPDEITGNVHHRCRRLRQVVP